MSVIDYFYYTIAGIVWEEAILHVLRQLTLGLGGIGAVIDFIIILIGGFRDKANMPLK